MLSLPATTDAPGMARRRVDRWLQRVGAPGPVRDGVCLVVSELVTNSVEHAASAPDLEIIRRAGTVRICVRDRDHRGPSLRDGRADGGFGLRIVAQTARRWGWEPTATGKIVWAEVPDVTANHSDRFDQSDRFDRSDQSDQSGQRANKRLVAAYHRRLWGDGDLTAIDDVIAPDAITHWGDAGSNTIAAVRADAERYFAGFTEVTTHIDDLVAESDKVVLRWSTTGVHTGPYGRVAATGRTITMHGVDIYRLSDGRIVEAVSTWDGLGAFQQLGLVADDIGP